MTDKERWISFLESFNIEWDFLQDTEGKNIIRLEAGSKKVKGYFGFCFEIYFDKDDNFIETGCWE